MANGHQAAMKEINNFKQGRSGGETPKKMGPVKSPAHNPTKGSGINRATTR